MVVDAVRAYLDAASGLTELTRKRAVAAAKTLLREDHGATQDGGGVGQSIQALATDLIDTSRSNQQALRDLVESEVERVLDQRDLVSRTEYDRLARRVAELERRLATQRAVARPVQVAGSAPEVHEAVTTAEPPSEGPMESASVGSTDTTAEPPAPGPITEAAPQGEAKQGNAKSKSSGSRSRSTGTSGAKRSGGRGKNATSAKPAKSDTGKTAASKPSPAKSGAAKGKSEQK